MVCGSGEHGYLAARTAAKVIKAYVEKKQRVPAKVAGSAKRERQVEIGAVWSAGDDGDADKLRGGWFVLDVAKRPLALATAAPGMQ
jgi:hypothetical protein